MTPPFQRLKPSSFNEFQWSHSTVTRELSPSLCFDIWIHVFVLFGNLNGKRKDITCLMLKEKDFEMFQLFLNYLYLTLHISSYCCVPPIITSVVYWLSMFMFMYAMDYFVRVIPHLGLFSNNCKSVCPLSPKLEMKLSYLILIFMLTFNANGFLTWIGSWTFWKAM